MIMYVEVGEGKEDRSGGGWPCVNVNLMEKGLLWRRRKIGLC